MMDTFTFGKYKGVSVNKIIHENPNYVKWCADNVCFFILSPDQEALLNNEFENRLSKNETRRHMRKYGMHATEAMDFLEYDVPEYF